MSNELEVFTKAELESEFKPKYKEENKIFNNNNEFEVSEVTDILLNTEEFNKLNNYNLPLIQYAIEILSKNKLSLLANLESLDNMYLLSKDELIEKLNM